jgi:major membrane immunogen (membrane-anchored lipoprotein)
MNATEAINSIVKLLGLQFKKESFSSTFLADGTTEVTNNSDSELAVGQTLFIVSDGTLVPAPMGEHETRDGMVVSLDGESTIIAIATNDPETSAEVGGESGESESSTSGSTGMDMTKATDAQGQVLESKTFDVGEDCNMVKEDGSSEPCPNGEHQVVLKDESGNENKIRIVVKDGKIVQRENVEGMMKPEMMNADFSKDINDIKESMSQLLSLVDSLNGKFKTELNSLKTDFDSFKKLPERQAVEEKKTYTESFADYKESVADKKLDIIKSLRK